MAKSRPQDGALKKNDLIQAVVEGMSSDGSGIVRHEGMVLFVPQTAVGDRLIVRVVKVQKNFGFGRVEEILEPSPDRVEPACPVYQTCGGCCFWHLSYEAELRHKADFVAENLRRLGGLSPQMLPITPSPRSQGYRNKAQYPIRLQNGRVEAGFFARRSHRLVPCSRCLLQPDFFGDIVEYTTDFLEKNRISIYDEETGKGLVRHLYLRFGEVSGQVMVCLVVNGDSLPHAEEYVQGLLACCPQVASVVLNRNTAQNNVILGEQCRTLYGTDTIWDELCGVKFALSPLSFYQVNHQAAQQLYGLARQMAQLTGEELLVDLYCGAGTIGLSMAPYVRQLIGVEIVPDAVENARQNAREAGVQNARFLCQDASSAAQELVKEGLRPDVIVVDPPRKGCDQQGLEAMVQMAPRRIVMISCNSASMARDCKALEQMGYRLVQAAPVDLFPRTAHVECVGVLVPVEEK